MRAEPAALHVLLDKLTELTISYLRMQASSGADAIQLFDSWAGLHDEAAYREFGLPYCRRIMDALAETGVVRMFFALGASHLMGAIAEIPAGALISVRRARSCRVERCRATSIRRRCLPAATR